MGHDCGTELDACMVGSEVYNAGEGETGPIIPPGHVACGIGSKCIPHLGTTSYSCQCNARFAMDRAMPFDNCYAKRDPCSSRICIEGTCIAAEVGQ